MMRWNSAVFQSCRVLQKNSRYHILDFDCPLCLALHFPLLGSSTEDGHIHCSTQTRRNFKLSSKCELSSFFFGSPNGVSQTFSHWGFVLALVHWDESSIRRKGCCLLAVFAAICGMLRKLSIGRNWGKENDWIRSAVERKRG
jgi:hypothetical protein